MLIRFLAVEAFDEWCGNGGAEPGNGSQRDEEERRYPRRVSAGQRDQLALSADEGRSGDSPRRRQPRRSRLLDSRGAMAGWGKAADPYSEHRDAGVGGFDPLLAD